MENYFERVIPYQGKLIGIKIQRLSVGLPLIYAVWPKDKLLKDSFDNCYVIFSQNIEKSEKVSKVVWHRVHYSKNAKSTDFEFEKAVWDELSKLESVKEIL